MKITISSKSSVQNINNSASHWSKSYATKLKNSKNVSPLKKLLFMRRNVTSLLKTPYCGAKWVSNFPAWPYFGANHHFKCLSLALLRCKMTFKFFELDLIAVQISFSNFRAWPYCGANRLGLIAMHQCTQNEGFDLNVSKNSFLRSLKDKNFRTKVRRIPQNEALNTSIKKLHYLLILNNYERSSDTKSCSFCSISQQWSISQDWWVALLRPVSQLFTLEIKKTCLIRFHPKTLTKISKSKIENLKNSKRILN